MGKNYIHSEAEKREAVFSSVRDRSGTKNLRDFEPVFCEHRSQKTGFRSFAQRNSAPGDEWFFVGAESPTPPQAGVRP
jgi:hypothetical protein